MTTRQIFRRLWQPPGRYADRPLDRRVTFLELFFDLVFVVVIARLAHHLAEHPDWAGVGWFAFLFFAVWGTWLNGTSYHDLHPTDDISVRIFTFLQMLTVAVMAVYIGDIPGDGASGFALAYAANNLVLVILWYRTGVHDPDHRPASVPYSSGYLVSVVLFALSAFVDPPLTYWLWGAGILSELLGQSVALTRWTPPDNQGQPRSFFVPTSSLIERFGLLVIIVLGEVVIGAVNGMADALEHGQDPIVIGLLGVNIAIGLWWLYFDLISHRHPVPERGRGWVFGHFPVVLAIAAVGAGVLNTVEHAGEPLPGDARWLLAGSVVVAVLAILGLTFTLQIRTELPEVYRTVDVALGITAVLSLGVGLTSWQSKGVLVALVVLLLAPVAAGLTVWLRTTTPDTVDLG